MSRFLDIQFDDDCLRRAGAGDRVAQRELYGLLAGPMFALARRVLRDHAAAEDVFQDSMLAVLGNLRSWRREAPFGAWARQVTMNQCLVHLRSPWHKARRTLRDWAGADERTQEPAVPTLDLPMPEIMDLERALAVLGDTPRAVLWLHDVEGLTHAEIGVAFGRTASFSKSQLARAHALLRSQLADDLVVAAPLLHADIAARGQMS